MKMNRLLLVALGGLLVGLAACTTSNTVEGQRVRATAETVTERVEVTGGLHDRAPQWFKDYWRAYLAHAAGGYATMAVDRGPAGPSTSIAAAGGAPKCDTVPARDRSPT